MLPIYKKLKYLDWVLRIKFFGINKGEKKLECGFVIKLDSKKIWYKWIARYNNIESRSSWWIDLEI
jgi:hypothetical protein